MSRLNVDGKDLKRVLSWLLARDVSDSEIAEALNLAASTYSRQKEEDGRPSFEDLTTVGKKLGLSARVLQITFGLLDTDALVLLDPEEMRQYLEVGGGNYPQYPLTVEHETTRSATDRERIKLERQPDVSPL